MRVFVYAINVFVAATVESLQYERRGIIWLHKFRCFSLGIVIFSIVTCITDVSSFISINFYIYIVTFDVTDD